MQASSISCSLQEHDKHGNCRNCGTQLAGEFCHQCGQSTAIVRRPAKELIEDSVGCLFQWDSRLIHTLQHLFFGPGRLSIDWVKGKRMRHVPPFRLYIIASFILFLMVGITTQGRNVDIRNVDLETAKVSEELKKAEQDAHAKGEWFSSALFAGASEAAQDPATYMRKITSSLPKAAFVLLPVFALLHMAVEFRKDRYYIDYRVFSLHFHAFAFLLLF